MISAWYQISGEEANTHSVISFVVGWSYFIVSWIEFDKTSGGLPTSPNRSSSNAAALESNRCLNMVYGQGHADRAGRSRTYLTTRLSSLLTASVSSLFIPDASLGVSGSNHLELAGDWNRYFLIKWDSRAKMMSHNSWIRMKYLPNKWLKLCERDANPRRKSLNRDITVAGAVPTSKYPTPFTYEIPFICFRFCQILWFLDCPQLRTVPLKSV